MRTMRRYGSAALVAAVLASTLASCGFGEDPRRDPALRVGRIAVGSKLRRLLRFYGRGTPAQWMDDRGRHVSVLLYSDGTAVLAAVVRDGRIDGIEAFQHMTPAGVHNEFALASTAEPALVRFAIADQSWLGAPLFSDTLPAVPGGWRVPTDFTVPTAGKSFYVVREGHAVSKTRADDYGWVLHLR